MMGHRERFINGDEWDVFKARTIVSFDRGVIKKVKRNYWKRLRQIARQEIMKEQRKI